jgi:putative ABC transport system ATP-binding protein
MTGTSQAIVVESLTRTYGSGEARVDALCSVDLQVRRGEFLAIMGPSGSGKSTLLHLMGGLEPPDLGAVFIEGQCLSDLSDDDLTCLRRQRIGFVFQAFNLLPILTAEENVALPLVLDGTPEAQANEAARAVLERVGVIQRKDHYPARMSGGEQQRVAIARALVTDPVVVLADEPTGNLDSRNSRQIIAALRAMVDEQNQTLVMVTHDASHAALADRLVRLRDGAIDEEHTLPSGRPLSELLENPESLS